MELGHSLALIAPEILLSVGGLVLLLAAAWLGDHAARGISVVAAIVLGGAFFLVLPSVLAGAAGPDTIAFSDQFRADAFAGFAKLMIYAASLAALVIAPDFFDRLRAMRAEYPV